jgi:hypothetical protein
LDQPVRIQAARFHGDEITIESRRGTFIDAGAQQVVLTMNGRDELLEDGHISNGRQHLAISGTDVGRQEALAIGNGQLGSPDFAVSNHDAGFASE